MNGHIPSSRFIFSSTDQGQYRAPTLQQAGNLQGVFKSGKIVVGTSLSYPSRHVAKTVAVTGAAWCWIDAEHVAWSQDMLIECIQIIIHESGGKMIPVVRVPSKTAFDYMAWCLDAGAGGIIIPHLDTVEEMKEVIAACRFPPIGHRSFPPFTFASCPQICADIDLPPLQIPGVTDTTPEGETVFSLANKHVAIIPQIESRVGIKNLEEIMKLKEISAFMIGAGDLRMEMGLSPGMTGDEPEFVAALEKAKRVSEQTNIPLLGVAIGPEMIKQRIDQGFKILCCSMDLHALAFGMMQTLGEARAVAEEHLQERHGAAK
ncbi:Pyruvate/Phosphoenolpyruvate kinase-like domain-containing protein [Mycena albidolilacea]|uniref:Pyruvate/Phosphoenolpyruvate kinase-like domain-containing protein n=1 Tax=Mycena albidolilacea TaxID=1033008 RepID=A0AAD7EEG2_9AGAR|nr:Pyruvate/Phosphoenolpyruvate kinase-like domain-containing protein [Mycena albidolilacea]